jgi:hypothetical protein
MVPQWAEGCGAPLPVRTERVGDAQDGLLGVHLSCQLCARHTSGEEMSRRSANGQRG